MLDTGQAIEMVSEDCARGLQDWLRPDGDIPGFRILEPFDADRDTLVGEATGAVAVVWAWQGRHEGQFSGVAPTGRLIEIRGVTIVRDGPDGGQRFQRFVDWIGALSAMGVSLFTRPIIDDGLSTADIEDLDRFEPVED